MYHFKARDLEIPNIFNLLCEILKCFENTGTLRNFAKSFVAQIFATFRYVAKRIIYLESPDQVL